MPVFSLALLSCRGDVMQQTMRLRLVDECGFAEEFCVHSPGSLMTGLNAAYVRFRQYSNCQFPALEMYLDHNHKWISPNFPSVFEYVLSTPLLSAPESGGLFQRIARMHRVLASMDNEEAQLETLYLWLSED